MPLPLPPRLILLTGLLAGLVPNLARSAPPPPSEAGPGLAAWFALVVLSLLVVLVAVLLWISRQRMQGGASSGIDVLGMRTLGPREQVLVVRIEDRILVLGHTPGQINLLAELEQYSPAANGQLAPAGFAQQLQRWLRRSQA